ISGRSSWVKPSDIVRHASDGDIDALLLPFVAHPFGYFDDVLYLFKGFNSAYIFNRLILVKRPIVHPKPFLWVLFNGDAAHSFQVHHFERFPLFVFHRLPVVVRLGHEDISLHHHGNTPPFWFGWLVWGRNPSLFPPSPHGETAEKGKD